MERDKLSALSFDSKQEDMSDESGATFKDKAEEIALTQQRVDIEKLKEELESLKQDRQQRKVLSIALFIFMCVYMAVALLIVFLCGLFVMYLSDTVLVTLLTTTLADVIGIFSFVTKYLYHNK